MSVIDKIFEGNVLTEREKSILRLRIAGKTLREIGRSFGLSRERIRQIGEKIKDKLKGNLTVEEQREYINFRKIEK